MGRRYPGLLGPASAGVQPEYGTAESPVPGRRFCPTATQGLWFWSGLHLALHFTAAPENRVKVAGLLIPATLTAMLVGITGTRWSSPSLFISRCCLPCTRCWRPAMVTVMYMCAGSGQPSAVVRRTQFLLQNCGSPCFAQTTCLDDVHPDRGSGCALPLSTSLSSAPLILRLNLENSGPRKRAKSNSTAKRIIRAARGKTNAGTEGVQISRAAGFLQALGGASNIECVSNCATRLLHRAGGYGETQSDDVFKAPGRPRGGASRQRHSGRLSGLQHVPRSVATSWNR